MKMYKLPLGARFLLSACNDILCFKSFSTLREQSYLMKYYDHVLSYIILLHGF